MPGPLLKLRLLLRPAWATRLAAVRVPRWAVPAGRVLTRRALPAAGLLLVILLWLGAHLSYGLPAIVAFDPPLGDGPYQLYNPLRRIAAGQRGGADFQYFHGVAVPYLHYPVFAATGKDVYASELSRKLVSLVLYVGGFLFVFAAATRRLIPTCALTAIALVIGDQVGAIGMWDLMWPTNSIIGVRSAVPFLVIGVLLAGLRPKCEAALAGAGAGVAVLLGTEHGVALAVALGLLWLARRQLGLAGGEIVPLLVGLAAFVAALAGLLLLITGPNGAPHALKYAFRDLPADQFWYFGAPPNRFVHSLRDFTDRPVWVTALGPASVLAAVIAGWMHRNPEARPLGVVLLAALGYGLLAGVGYLGYVAVHYAQPLSRVAVTVGLVLAWRAGRWAATESPFAESAARGLKLGAAALAGVLILAGPTPKAPSSVLCVGWMAGEIRPAVADLAHGRGYYGPRLAAHMAELTRAIDADRAARGITRPPVIWSTYAGELEAHYGVLHPQVDYIIHAIGPAGREEYLAAFRKANPDYVTTYRRDSFSYEEWLQQSTWPFYEELLLNYEPVLVGSLAVLWRRTGVPWRTPDPAAGRVSYDPIGPHMFSVPVPPGLPPDTLLVVEVEYAIRNPLRPVPVLGGLPRFLLAPADCRNETPVSLPPYRTSWTFPVFPIPGKTPIFYAGTFSLAGGKVTITKVHVRPLLVGGRERALLSANPPATR